MKEEQQTAYAYKDDLIGNHIHLVIHEALKFQPSEIFDLQEPFFKNYIGVF
jgi:AraC family transcriptional activator of pobA